MITDVIKIAAVFHVEHCGYCVLIFTIIIAVFNAYKLICQPAKVVLVLKSENNLTLAVSVAAYLNTTVKPVL